MSLQIVSLLLSAAGLVLAAGPDNNKPWSYWIRRADALHQQGDFAQSIEAGQHALKIARDSDRSEAHVALSYMVLGSVYRDWGRCSDANNNYLRAVTLFEKLPKPNAGYAFSAIVGLINTASECEQYRAAEKLYHAHSAALERFRAGPLDDAKILSIQGGIARGKKRFAEAEDYFRRALQLMERTPGATLADLAETRSCMALMLDHQGRHEEALAESQRAIADLETASPRSVMLPAALNNAGCVLMELQRWDEAERLYQRALQLARELFGEDNRNTAEIMLNYSLALRKNKELPAAESLKQKGIESYRRSLMHDNQTVDVKDLMKSR